MPPDADPPADRPRRPDRRHGQGHGRAGEFRHRAPAPQCHAGGPARGPEPRGRAAAPADTGPSGLSGDDGSYFWLSPRVLRFSGSYLSSARLPRVLQPTLSRLAAADAGLLLRGGARWRRGGHRRQQRAGLRRGAGTATRLLAYGLHLGARLPAHATSTGRMLLACLGAAQCRDWLKRGRELPRLTAHTITAAWRNCARCWSGRGGRTGAWPAKSMSWACMRWPCRCATSRARRWPPSMWCCPAPARTRPGRCAQWLPPLQQAARELRPLL
jgi:hypothetical protein